MEFRSRFSLVMALVLTAPATFSIAASALSATGIRAPAAFVDTLFAAFRVEYVAAARLVASTALRPNVRWPLYTVTAVAALSAMFWVVWSLANA